ncbi:uncharacterized protein K452DRAFT_314819 [Aplosporella prunicola CBS 121167]|uniref:SMP domain-containing protein n=1 Tax=Aplosporella prunicola CBS 121167 TaxID=1176127 RepID=A0A6A6BTL9_9PEZI|nr:uncharacterized protein K452DRAFT_314819 [Aplosporella prunicola CBS 121167]KAF2146564.1 hypothetical protein K452DRAFT_314819 [Aplosporella prunicola CBS 121167]
MAAQPTAQPTPGEPAAVKPIAAQSGAAQPTGSQGDTQSASHGGTQTGTQTGSQTCTQVGTQAGTQAPKSGVQPIQVQPTQTSIEPVTQSKATAPPVGIQTQSETIAEKVDQEVAAKLRDDPMHITHEDAARAQSAEQRALGHRPPHGSIAAQAQSQADKVDNFHAVADPVQQEMKTDPSHVTSEEARHVLSAEHKALGHYPPKDSLSAEVQRLAAANERSAGTAIGTATNTDTKEATGTTDTTAKVSNTNNADTTVNTGTQTSASSNNENNTPVSGANSANPATAADLKG